MKKFTKLFLSCALVSAMAVTAAASAFAAPESVKIEGNELTGTVTIGDTVTISELAIAGKTVKPDTQVTFLVFKGVTDVATDASNVEGIDQGTSVKPANNGLKSAAWSDTDSVVDATYTVMVGYTDSADDQFKVAKGTFALAESKGEEFILGEVDGEAELSTIDATYILRAANESTKEHGDALKKIVLSEALEDIPAGKTINLGEVDGDAIEENVTTVDATYVLRFANESTKATGYAGKTVIATAAE